MNMGSEIEKLRHMMIEAMGHSVGIWGMNETFGRMFGLLYFADAPLSLDEMAAELHVSKATISINIRILEKTRSVQKVWLKGSRKDHYVVERDFNKILQEALRTTAMEEIKIHKQAIGAGLSGYEAIVNGDFPEEVREQARRDFLKVQELAHWLKVGERWLNFIIESDVSEGPAAELKRIEVEWEDEG